MIPGIITKPCGGLVHSNLIDNNMRGGHEAGFGVIADGAKVNRLSSVNGGLPIANYGEADDV